MRAVARVYSAVLALAALVALAIHFRYSVDLSDPLRGVVRYFSYFTIISNYAVALTCGVPLVARSSAVGRFFASPRTRAAVAIYITVTGAVYALLLAHLWHPQGARWVSNGILHYVVPVAYVLGWIVFTPHARLRWSDALRFLVVPAAYLAWILARGAMLDEYPYPFLNLDKLGAAGFARSAAGLGVFFALLGVVTVAADKLLGKLGAGQPDGPSRA